MEQVSLARTLARFIRELSYNELPQAVIERAKTRILDALTACFVGRDLSWSQIATKLAGKSKGQSTIFGYDGRVAAIDAAFANAVLSHSVLLEDWTSGAGHAGVVVVPVVLAVAEEESLAGIDVVTAIVLGYDAHCRIGLGLGDRKHPGFRAVPVLGPFGAVAAAGKLLKLTEDQLTNALGYAANVASGVSENWAYGSMEGMFHAGMAARNGILVTTLAKMGATAAETALEGKHGFYTAFSSRSGDTSVVTADLGKRFLIMEQVVKLYPACGNNQIPIDLALTLKKQYNIDPKDIEKIIVGVQPRIKFVAGQDFAGPFANQFQAQMSSQFCLAAAFLGSPVGSPSLYTQDYDDPQILALASKVEIVADEGRGNFSSRVEVSLKGGRHYATEEDRLFKFIPTREITEEKFMTYVSAVVGRNKAAEIVDAVMTLDKLDNITTFTYKLFR